MANKVLVTEESGLGFRFNLQNPYIELAEEFGEPVTDYKEFVKNPDDFKLILFTGGADVSPEFYGETGTRLCMVQPGRDRRERAVFNYGIHHKIKMAGICRGLQFCHVMAGGKLLHHLDGHENSRHYMQTSLKKANNVFHVNSYHHQMIIPDKNTHILGWSESPQSHRYFGDGDVITHYDGLEIEAAIIPSINFVGVQYHPEWIFQTMPAWKFFVDLVEDHIKLDMADLVLKYPARKRNRYANNLRTRYDFRARRTSTGGAKQERQAGM